MKFSTWGDHNNNTDTDVGLSGVGRFSKPFECIDTYFYLQLCEDCYYHPHFTDEKTETQQSPVMLLKVP